eukprot:scaffold317096_cov51-Attheya_sp.AAC.3
MLPRMNLKGRDVDVITKLKLAKSNIGREALVPEEPIETEEGIGKVGLARFCAQEWTGKGHLAPDLLLLAAKKPHVWGRMTGQTLLAIIFPSMPHTQPGRIARHDFFLIISGMDPSIVEKIENRV